MKKSAFILSLILLLIQKSYAQNVKTLNGAETINGKVMKVIGRHYEVGKDSEMTSSLGDTTIYDEKGSILESRLGSLLLGSTTVKYEYADTNQNEKKVTETSYTSELPNIERDSYIDKYNNVKNIIESDFYANDNTFLRKCLFKYDQNSNMIEAIGYDSKGKLEFREVHKYNNSNFLIEEDTYETNSDHNLQVFYSYQSFDKKGNWIKREEVWKTGIGTASYIVERKITYY